MALRNEHALDVAAAEAIAENGQAQLRRLLRVCVAPVEGERVGTMDALSPADLLPQLPRQHLSSPEDEELVTLAALSSLDPLFQCFQGSQYLSRHGATSAICFSCDPFTTHRTLRYFI